MASDSPPQPTPESAPRDPLAAARVSGPGCLAGAGVAMVVLGLLLIGGAPTLSVILIALGVVLALGGLFAALRGRPGGAVSR